MRAETRRRRRRPPTPPRRRAQLRRRRARAAPPRRARRRTTRRNVKPNARLLLRHRSPPPARRRVCFRVRLRLSRRTARTDPQRRAARRRAVRVPRVGAAGGAPSASCRFRRSSMAAIAAVEGSDAAAAFARAAFRLVRARGERPPAVSRADSALGSDGVADVKRRGEERRPRRAEATESSSFRRAFRFQCAQKTRHWGSSPPARRARRARGSALHEPAQQRVPTARAKAVDRPRVVRVADGASVLVADDFLADASPRRRASPAVLPQAADQALQRDGLLLRETSRRGEHEDERVHSCGFKARPRGARALCV